MIIIHGVATPSAAALQSQAQQHAQLRQVAARIEIVLEAAANGRSNAIVTHNVRQFQPAAGEFVRLPLEGGRGERSQVILQET